MNFHNDEKLLIASLIVAEKHLGLSNFSCLNRSFYNDEDLWAFSVDKHKYLWKACLDGNLDRVKWLVEKCSASVNKKSLLDYKNAVNFAMDGGHLNVVSYLVTKKAYPGNINGWREAMQKILNK
jgi:hypothetical protein